MLKIKNTLSLAAFLCGLLICFAASDQIAAQNTQAIPLYRLFSGYHHIYTTDKNERDKLLKIDFMRDQGIAAYVFPKQLPGLVPLFRLHSKNNVQKNFYTISEAGKKGAMSKYAYVDNGIVGYVLPDSTVGATDAVAFHRMYMSLYGGKIDNHFYTTSGEEVGKATLDKVSLAINPYVYEKIECFVWTWAITYGADGNPISSSGSKNGKAVIDKAFLDVYGYVAPAERFSHWKSMNVYYENIVAGESKRQNAEPLARKLMINRVYKDTMGRVATKDDMDYWLPKAEYYKQIVDANRNFLYSPFGAKDLTETVTRALKTKNGKPPNEEEVNTAITKYRKTKAIYDEM